MDEGGRERGRDNDVIKFRAASKPHSPPPVLWEHSYMTSAMDGCSCVSQKQMNVLIS